MRNMERIQQDAIDMNNTDLNKMVEKVCSLNEENKKDNAK